MAGFDIKSQQEIINDMLLNIVTIIDDIDDVNVGSVLRTLTEALGIELSQLYEQLQNIYDGTRIDTSTGDDLDNLGKLLGIVRKQGTKSVGNVSFIRQTPATVDFTIPASTIISTQPNTEDPQLRFLVDTTTTFSAEITAESHKFVNGLYDYVLDERFMDSISLLDGTVSSAPFTFTENTDFEIIKNFTGVIIDPDTVVVLDDCDAISNWNNSTGADPVVLDNTEYRQGTGSLKLGKLTALDDTIYYHKVLSTLKDISDLNGLVWLYIKDTATLNKLKEIKLTVGSGGSIINSYSLKFNQSALAVGWNKIKTDFTLTTIDRQGFPNESAINYLRLTITTNNISDLLASGDMNMDFWIGATTEDYKGDAISWLATGTLPDNGTDFNTTYKPLSKEVSCEAENVGITYNVAKEKIIYKVSFVSNIDSVRNYDAQLGGTDTEIDDDLRERILYATELLGKATVESLRQAVLGVEGVTSVSVDDMPLRSRGAETHEHISYATTPTLKLDYEVALDNTNFEVRGTRGATPITFIKNTDYYMEDTTIIWVDDTKDPDDGTLVETDYDYRWLGHVDIFVAGTSTPLPVSIQANIQTAVDDTRSAGIDVTWAEPIIVTIPITVNITARTGEGYIYDDVAVEVNDAIELYLNIKETGADVLIAEIIDVVMSVEGVYNTTVSLPGADVIINVDEIARPGTITVNEIP